MRRVLAIDNAMNADHSKVLGDGGSIIVAPKLASALATAAPAALGARPGRHKSRFRSEPGFCKFGDIGFHSERNLHRLVRKLGGCGV
jgi:hypothetical protein